MKKPVIALIIIFIAILLSVVWITQPKNNPTKSTSEQNKVTTHSIKYLGETINYTSGCGQDDFDEYHVDGVGNISHDCIDEDSYEKVKKITQRYGDKYFVCEVETDNFDDYHEIDIGAVNSEEHQEEVRRWFENKLETRLLESIYTEKDFYSVGQAWHIEEDDHDETRKERRIVYSYNVNGQKAAFVKANACSFYSHYGESATSVRYVLDPYQQVKKHIYANKTIQEFEDEMEERGFNSQEIYRVEQEILP